MATGDAAAGKGLKTYGDSLLVKDIDTALNQRGDDIAAVMSRADKLEAQTIGVPKFSVGRSTNGQNIQAENWTQMTAGAWGKPVKNTGGFTWSGGTLTVPRAGIYSVQGTAHFYHDDFVTVAVQITRNTTALDTANTICKAEQAGYSDPGADLSPSASAVRLMVPMNAGDVLRFYVLQRNRGGQTWNTGPHTYDLVWDVLWVDSL